MARARVGDRSRRRGSGLAVLVRWAVQRGHLNTEQVEMQIREWAAQADSSMARAAADDASSAGVQQGEQQRPKEQKAGKIKKALQRTS